MAANAVKWWACPIARSLVERLLPDFQQRADFVGGQDIVIDQR